MDRTQTDGPAGNGYRVEELTHPGAQGLRLVFPEAEVSVTTGGVIPCTCGEDSCPHLHQASAAFSQWKWRYAQKHEDWGPSLLVSLGIPPIAVCPELVESRWAPRFQRQDGARVYVTHHRLADGRQVPGVTVHFDDGGHVFVGEAHPDGHTPCLGCNGRGDTCDHVARALAIASTGGHEPAGHPPHPLPAPGTGGEEADREERTMSNNSPMTLDEQLQALSALVDEWAIKRDRHVKGRYTSGEYVEYQLRRIFGPHRWSFTVRDGPEIVRISESEAYARVTGRLHVTFADGTRTHQDAPGVWPLRATNAAKGGTLETTAAERFETVLKAACTDALKCAAERIGSCFRPLGDLELEGTIKRWAYYESDEGRAERARTAAMSQKERIAEVWGSDEGGNGSGNAGQTPGNGNGHNGSDDLAARARAYRVNFGPHDGQTLGHLADGGDEEQAYLAWLAGERDLDGTKFVPTDGAGKKLQAAAKYLVGLKQPA